MAFLISNLRLSHKIGATGVVGVAGLLAVGAIYFTGSAIQNGYRKTAEDVRAIGRGTDQSAILLLDTRRAEKDFLLRQDEKYLKRHSEIVSKAVANYDDLTRRVAAANLPEIARHLAAVRQRFDTYVKDFATLVDAKRHQGLDQNSGLQGTLRKSVHAVEDKLAAVDDARLTAAMLMMRRHEKDYLLRGDAAYRDEFLKSATEFGNLVASAALPAELKRELAANLDAYRKDFVAWTQAAEATVKAQEALSATYAAMEPENEAMQQGVNDALVRAVDADARSRAATELQMEIAIAAIAILAAVLAFLIGRSVSRPLSAMTLAMRKLAEGDFEVVLPGLGRKDEVGEMAQAVETFKTKAVEKARDEAEKQQAEARVAAARRKADMVKLADEFEKAVGEIVQTVSSASTELEASAITLTKTAETTEQLSVTVAAASEQASTNVQSVASATEELTASVTEISRQVLESSRISHEAVDQAHRTDSRITKLAEAASRIGDVTQLITSIAEQTNLLALNATIEAARAGVAGKGFAVVASEVKQLASQTAKATSEISTQIAEMQSATQDSVTAIKEIGGTIGRISEIATTIASAVEQQGAATQEITRNVQQAAAGTTQVASNITSVSRGAAETGSASSAMLTATKSLAGESNRLKLEMSKFLATVRAA
jgi:methyl-accepting chemotaxis protein